MQLYCQTCQAAFAGVSHCPKCGGRLLSPQESFIHSGSPTETLPDPEPPTLGNRLAVGAGVGLGLYFGLREVLGACGVVSLGSPAAGAVDIALRVAGVLAGGLLAGAGRDRGLPVGLAAGLVIAGVLLAADVFTAGGPAAAGTTPLVVAGVLTVLAAPAGAVGARVWPPAPDLPQVLPTRGSSHGSSLSKLVEEEAVLRAPRPTQWIRILAGAAIAAAGLLASDEIRTALAKVSLGLLQTGGAHRGPLVGFQIAVILLTLGGMFAGATTGTGFRHGLFAGLFAAVSVYLAAANRPDAAYPAIDGYFATFDREVRPISEARPAAEVMALVLGLTTAGGWLGGQLFPPLAPPHMRKRRLVSQT
jgi:hypothetical protein